MDNGTVAEIRQLVDLVPPRQPAVRRPVELVRAGQLRRLPRSDNPASAQAQVVAFSDVDGSGKMIYAVMCSSRDTQRGMEFLYDFPSGCFGDACSPIAMQPAPRATIVGTTHSADQANITVASPRLRRRLLQRRHAELQHQQRHPAVRCLQAGDPTQRRSTHQPGRHQRLDFGWNG